MLEIPIGFSRLQEWLGHRKPSAIDHEIETSEGKKGSIHARLYGAFDRNIDCYPNGHIRAPKILGDVLCLRQIEISDNDASSLCRKVNSDRSSDTTGPPSHERYPSVMG